jgi:hypothetical protein
VSHLLSTYATATINADINEETVIRAREHETSRITASVPIGDEEDSVAKKEEKKERRTAYFVAVSPISDLRFRSLWSQLECFTSTEKIQTVVIVAPGWSQREGYLEKFVQHAKDRIPHLKDRKVVIKYYMNDRYDVGLWCDAAQDKLDVDNNSSIFDLHDDFIVTNDSVMAAQENYSGVLDSLREENLNMTSLNYSFLHDKNDLSLFSHQWIFSRSDKMWLESALRAFNHDGMKTFLSNVCVPPDHPYFCPSSRNRAQRKRCVVESMEIRIAGLYKEDQVKGLFPADAPDEYSDEGPMWHSNYRFWEFLYKTRNFPAIKVSSNVLMEGARQRAKEVFPICTKYLHDSYLGPIRRRRIDHPRSKH